MKTNLELARECGAAIMLGDGAGRTIVVCFESELDAFADRVLDDFTAKLAATPALPGPVFEQVAPNIEVGYDMFGGVDIRVGGDFVYVHINYDYRYTHNSARRALADNIVRLLREGWPKEAQRQAVQMPVAWPGVGKAVMAFIGGTCQGVMDLIIGLIRADGPLYTAPQPAVEPVVARVLEQALQAMAPMRGLIIFDQAMQAVQDLLERSHKNESLPTTKPMTQIEIDTMIDNFPAHSWDTDELIVRAVERHHGIGLR